MAEPVGIATTIIGLITAVQGLISSIQKIASNVRYAQKKAESLATRCAKINYCLQRIENFPDCHNEALKSHLDQFVDIFKEVKQFLLKFERKGTVATCKRILKNGKYVAKYDELERSLNIAIIDLTLWQTINFPNDKWDNEDPLPADQPHSFPPTLEEMAPPAEGSDDEEEYDSIPWDFHPRPETCSGFSSSSPMCAKSLESKKSARRDYYERIDQLRKLDQNTRIRAFRVCLSELEPGDTSIGVRTAQIINSVFATPLGLVVFPFSSRLSCAITASCETLSHFSIEFILSNGVIGTIENCTGDVYLYAGKSSRKEKHGVMGADLVELGIERTLGDLIILRNKHRKQAYSTLDNNCKHFAFHAVIKLVGEHEFGFFGTGFYSFRDLGQIFYGSTKMKCPYFARMKRNDERQLEWKLLSKADDLKIMFGA